jgi:hypothetical protein
MKCNHDYKVQHVTASRYHLYLWMWCWLCGENHTEKRDISYTR